MGDDVCSQLQPKFLPAGSSSWGINTIQAPGCRGGVCHLQGDPVGVDLKGLDLKSGVPPHPHATSSARRVGEDEGIGTFGIEKG